MNRRKREAVIILFALAITMLDFIKFPGARADGPFEPYYWPVLTGDTLIWEHQHEGGVVTYEKWVLYERNWTQSESKPGNYSETIWFEVSRWNGGMGLWERIPYLYDMYPADQPAPICSANLTYQYWDYSGLGDYIWGYPDGFLNGIDPNLNAFFLPRHEVSDTENWNWLNESYYNSIGKYQPSDIVSSLQSNKLVFLNTSNGNSMFQYYNYTIYNEGYSGHNGAILKDFAQFYPNGTLFDRWLLRQGPSGYSYDEYSTDSELTWGVKKGDKLIWYVDNMEYKKWEIAGFGAMGPSAREILYASSYTWNSVDTKYVPTSIGYNPTLPTELPQMATAANGTWQYFDLQGNVSNPIWGYPYGFGAGISPLDDIRVLPLQAGSVNMTWFEQGYRELLIMMHGSIPADIELTTNGLTLTVTNTSLGVAVEHFNYTSKGVLSYLNMTNWVDCTPFAEMRLVRGPGLAGSMPPSPVYQWGINEMDSIMWMMQGSLTPMPTFTKWEIFGFWNYLNMRELIATINYQWNNTLGKWQEQSGSAPTPPDAPQPSVWANLTWQYFDYSGMGDYMWGYPYAWVGGGGNPQLNCMILPLQGGSVNMSWFNVSYMVRYAGSPPAELSFAIDGLNYTVTNTTSGVIVEKYTYNELGIMQHLCMRDLDNSILLEIIMLAGPGFPPSPAPPTALTWGVSPKDEIIWDLGPDMEDPTNMGQMKWNISFIEFKELYPGFMREIIYGNVTKFNTGTGEWEYFHGSSGYPPEVQPMILANATWQYFQWNLGAFPEQYTWGYPYGVVGYTVPFFTDDPSPSYNEMIVPLQSGVVNMSWINESWYGCFTAGMGGIPPDFAISVAGNTLRYTNTTSTEVQFELSYTTLGILERSFMKSWDDNYMWNYTLVSAPGYADTTPPSIAINAPTPFQVFGNATPGFQVTITDAHLASTWYKLGGSNFTFVGSTGTLDATTWAAQGNGTVDITFYANDTSGQQSELLLTVRKDSTPPILTINQPTIAYDSNLPPNYDLTITETNREAIWYTLDGGLTNYTASGLTGTISSAAWSVCPSGSVTINFYVNDTGTNWVNNSVTVTKRGPLLNVNFPVQNTLYNASIPTYSVTVAYQTGVCYSFNGGTNFTITESTTPGIYTGSFDATAWQSLVNGTHAVTFAANDSSGVWVTIDVLIHKDIQSPIIEINAPTSAYSSCEPPAFSLTITEGNLDDIWYTIDMGVTNYTCGTSGTIDTNAWRAAGGLASVTIIFCANDTGNNLGVNGVVVEKLVPLLVVGEPTPNLWHTTTPPTITAGAAYYQNVGYNLNGGNNFTFTLPSVVINQAAWDAQPDGTVTIRIFANDTFGNYNITIVTVRKDVTKPSISITAPTSGVTTENAPSFTLSITEPYRNQSWYTLNGGTATYFTGNSGTISATAWAALADGKVTIRFYVSDEAGNVNYQEITVNKGKPAEFPWLYVIIAAAAGAGVVGFVLVQKKRKGRTYTPSTSGIKATSSTIVTEKPQVLEKPEVNKAKPTVKPPEEKKKPKDEPLPRKKIKEAKQPKPKKGKQKGFWSNLPTESSAKKKY